MIARLALAYGVVLDLRAGRVLVRVDAGRPVQALLPQLLRYKPTSNINTLQITTKGWEKKQTRTFGTSFGGPKLNRIELLALAELRRRVAEHVLQRGVAGGVARRAQVLPLLCNHGKRNGLFTASRAGATPALLYTTPSVMHARIYVYTCLIAHTHTMNISDAE